MMGDGRITTEQRGHVLMMGIDRVEKRNAISFEMFAALAQAYGELDQNDDLRCGVLFAHGDHFTGGIDLPQWAPIFAAGGFPDVPEGSRDPLGLTGARLRKPVVMAAQGYCYTIGIELMLATDVRVIASNTRFAQIEIQRGLYPVGGATVRLALEVGWGNAMRYLLTGDTFGAEEAYRMGLVQEVVEPGQQLERALTIAETIAAQAPLGVYATLKSARYTRLAAEQEAIQHLLPDLLPLMQSADAQEGMMSFMERRPGQFEGR